MPVVCVRLSEEALARLDARARGDRSAWLRGVVHKALGLERGTDGVEAITPRPPVDFNPLVPGDTITVVEPGGIRP